MFHSPTGTQLRKTLKTPKVSSMKSTLITKISRTDTMLPNGRSQKPMTKKSGLLLIKHSEKLLKKRDRLMREEELLKKQKMPWNQPLTISSKSMMTLLKKERTKPSTSLMKLTSMLETMTSPKVHQSCQKMIHQIKLHQLVKPSNEQYESASKLNTLKL